VKAYINTAAMRGLYNNYFYTWLRNLSKILKRLVDAAKFEGKMKINS
jgi:hypothetical protein